MCCGRSFVFTSVNALTGFLGLLVIVGYVLLYTPLKTKTTLSTAIGTIPGAMPPLIGWTSATNQISIEAWLLFAIILLWQFPHFWLLHGCIVTNMKELGF